MISAFSGTCVGAGNRRERRGSCTGGGDGTSRGRRRAAVASPLAEAVRPSKLQMPAPPPARADVLATREALRGRPRRPGGGRRGSVPVLTAPLLASPECD